MLQMTHNHMLLQNTRFFVMHVTIINKNIENKTILEHVS